MILVFLQTLPFFAIIGLGFGAGKRGFFTAEATAYLTKFVFYFALPAMLISFSGTLELSQFLDWGFLAAYLCGTLAAYILVTIAAMLRGLSVAEAAIEAQCGVIGNVGFLGIPMLILLLGPDAIGPLMMVLMVDLIIFGSLVVVLITGSRGQGVGLGVLKNVGLGILKNPMVMSIIFGVFLAATAIPIPDVVQAFLKLLGAAATPCALFAIGASLADKSAERISVAAWLSLSKLLLHPLAVAIFAMGVFGISGAPLEAMIMAAALPVAGNVYIIAQQYGVAPARVSAAILVSTAVSIITIPALIGTVTGG